MEYTSKCLTSERKVPRLQLLSVQHGGARCRNTHVPISILFLFSHLSHSVNSEALGYVFFSSSMVESNASKPFWLHMVILVKSFPCSVDFPTPDWNKGDLEQRGRESPPPRRVTGDSLSILRRKKPIIILLCCRLDAFQRRLGQFLEKPPCDRTPISFWNVCIDLEQTW